MDNKGAQIRDIKILDRKNQSHELKFLRTNYNFKRVDVKEWEVMSAAAVLEYVTSRGFDHIVSLKKIGNYKPYIRKEDAIYVLMSIARGQKLKLRSQSNALILAEELGRFHNAAEGFTQPPGIKLRVEWGKRLENYRMAATRIEKYISYIQNKETLNEFEKYTSQYTDLLMKRAKSSMKILKSIGYLRALEDSMKRKEICINGISGNTAVISEDGVIITKIFEVGYNMVEEDVADLIKKTIENTGDLGVFDKIISCYSKIRELQEDSERIIRAIVSYPYESIKAILKYYNHTRDMLEEDREYNSQMLEKFQKYISRELLTDVLEG